MSHLTTVARKAFSPTGPSHPRSQSGSGLSGFWLLCWIFHPGNPILCLEFGLEEKQRKIWNDICKEEEIFFFRRCIQELWYPLYPSNSLGGEVTLCENQSKSDCSSMSIERAFERWKNCQLYAFGLDSVQALPEGIPFAWCLRRDRKGGRNPGTRYGLLKCKKQFLLMKNDMFPRLG